MTGARSNGCITCAWHGVCGGLCYCPQVVEAGRAAQLDLFAAPLPATDLGTCPLTGRSFRRLHLGERGIGGCEHWLGIHDRTGNMPWLDLTL